MTQIIVIATEGGVNVGITFAGDLTATQAVAVCGAAVRYFQEQAVEAEVLRRVSELEAERAEEGVGAGSSALSADEAKPATTEERPG